MEPETSDNTKTTIDQIKNRIAELVESHFNKGEQIIYLSRLGEELGLDRLTLEACTGLKLPRFIQENFDYVVGKTGRYGNVLYLARSGADVTSSITLPVPQHSSEVQERLSSPPARYISRFWAAFAKPLELGQTERFINLSTLMFGPDRADLQTGITDDIRPIGQEYITPQDQHRNVSETAEHIARWLSSQNLDGRNYLYVAKPSANKHESVLAVVINALSPDQLKRTSLSLDVVKALLERRL